MTPVEAKYCIASMGPVKVRRFVLNIEASIRICKSADGIRGVPVPLFRYKPRNRLAGWIKPRHCLGCSIRLRLLKIEQGDIAVGRFRHLLRIVPPVWSQEPAGRDRL